ncbi:hypothetical protein AMIS_20540 [Actinoplanes missouriensis 431]|uniref:Uncharacterized protein n=1 Tax=Actinoplanes missouriensis (strain ATCC 14538 / DSM 43046 / CBS 188.64 / JCM 3121 / NBRC 102363 / NCIMB 12654 / NRRL B-3342 / UNCC 431) TaxID=512565 RepID=I0H2N7_ACTM4|nr:hypothetical protein [Actinoplanes missouriensis]BAL87274.1 hypothetical protein AMIS_20540 [Actinoplanes missouriensis 431]
MVTVKFIDADNHQKVLLDSIKLPFEPRPGVRVEVWDKFIDRKVGFFEKRNCRILMLVDVYQYEISTEEPERSGIVYLAREIKD